VALVGGASVERWGELGRRAERADDEENAMGDFDEVRKHLDSEEALAALDRIETENRRFREALEAILDAPLRGGSWHRASDNPRFIARFALAGRPQG
jgi:hypothetical protein